MPEVRRSADRYRTVGDGTETWHSFSHGAHYDADNIAFGPVVAINDERLAPGAGYDEHHHSDAEIITWVIEGVLRHRDSTGRGGDIAPGTAQRLSAGEGVTHAERNASAVDPLRFIQMMVLSTNVGVPTYTQSRVPGGPGRHEIVTGHDGARLFVVRTDVGRPVTLPAADAVLLHVVHGPVAVGDLTLNDGDELRSAAPGEREITSSGPAEVLTWLVASEGTR